jgi:hypothetical protein
MLREIKMPEKTRWVASMACKYALVLLGAVLYTLLVARGAEAKAARKYEAWQERWVNEYITQQEAARLGMPVDPHEAQLDAEAQALARVLYGVKDNSTDDLRTYCWCVFNRVDSPDYADTLEEVIEQPSQWMRYDPENPVIENLYQLAREELEAWHNGATRPCSADFIYMTWSPMEIVLRNTWTNGSSTRYWRIKE